jgi:hypothetical protein
VTCRTTWYVDFTGRNGCQLSFGKPTNTIGSALQQGSNSGVNRLQCIQQILSVHQNCRTIGQPIKSGSISPHRGFTVSLHIVQDTLRDAIRFFIDAGRDLVKVRCLQLWKLQHLSNPEFKPCFCV